MVWNISHRAAYGCETAAFAYSGRKEMERSCAMEEKENRLAAVCDFRDVRPIMMELPYPPLRVQEKNQSYANLLSIDYCGSVSEMTAIAQYINHENRLACDRCPTAKTILGIAMAEMIHLQKLGELIFLLGGTVEFIAKYRDGNSKMWTPQYLQTPEKAREMIQRNIEAEKAAIQQYRMHIKLINDKAINAVLIRIIKDEEYHIMVLQSLLEV